MPGAGSDDRLLRSDYYGTIMFAELTEGRQEDEHRKMCGISESSTGYKRRHCYHIARKSRMYETTNAYFVT